MIQPLGTCLWFNESISFVVTCENQQELDLYWNRLTSDGGREGQCGWCTDRFGVSWQVVPVQLGQLMADPVRRTHAMAAFRGMTKIILADLT
jgi:predicted 3-demethylubiquinone-9 3-methyltransferase (glyoxalase superfamily)